MAKGNRETEAGGGDSWLMTYCSVVIILISIFVMIFSYSTVERKKMEGFSDSIGGKKPPADAGRQGSGMGNPEEAQVESVLKSVEKILQERAVRDRVTTLRTRKGFRVTFTGKDFFSPESLKMREEVHPLLDELAQAVRGTPLQVGIAVMNRRPSGEGSARSSWEHAAVSANLVLRYLNEKGGIPNRRLAAAGFANLQPVTGESPGGAQHQMLELFFEMPSASSS
jgi:chemotaxis protein MotB